MLGRRVVWSDEQIREFVSKHFVCVIDECFDLAPPDWVKREWLSNPKGTDLFTKYRASSKLFPDKPQTVQGFYCMTAEGEHLSGVFGRTNNDQAREIITTAWNKFKSIADKRGWEPKEIPDDKIELVIGKETERGGVKLQIASRDLPRGANRRPGEAEWEREAYNLNWLDLTREQASHFVAGDSKKQRIPDDLFKHFAKETLKDNVRGQNGWHDRVVQSGEMQAEKISNEGDVIHSRITGYAIQSEDNRKVAMQIHGQTRFDKTTGEFVAFNLFASGQRTGFSPANGRRHDQGPAPIGIAFRLYEKED